ncbi:energy-coupling factor transporter transmembrane component T family protein [Clostridium oryzae]|uniref:Energy-coupling factor transporter transmembrane protein EcfT n=1 Tax=Clostridium oryzae TaxID=1450648 RepID=A0A1V4ILG1_9CLOT|nr:energy-coupling factor transporter transmembrane component T [Clostridium oryzae]OPJ60660.1 energy-coupling factor transporter transmembrane protein EcfT [Clostridium oryzae]
MIRDITIGQYIPGDSFVHKLDPRTKIILSFLYIIELFIIKNFTGYLFAFAFILITVLLAKIPLKYIFRGLKPIFILLLFTAVLNLFMVRTGKVIYSYGFVTIYYGGLRTASFMTIRLVLLIIGTSVLTLTTSPIELTDGIERLLNPFKKLGLPAHEFAMMMTIALRFIPTLIDETDKIMKAQMARGADFDSGNIVQKAKSLIPLLVPLFVNSFRRADELAMAMEARCYRGGKGRTRMKVLKFSCNDLIASLAFVLLIIITIITNIIALI